MLPGIIEGLSVREKKSIYARISYRVGLWVGLLSSGLLSWAGWMKLIAYCLELV